MHHFMRDEDLVTKSFLCSFNQGANANFLKNKLHENEQSIIEIFAFFFFLDYLIPLMSTFKIKCIQEKEVLKKCHSFFFLRRCTSLELLPKAVRKMGLILN